MAGSKVVRSRGERIAWLVGGHLCLVLGVIGIILPIMPTTVFLIGAAACYARGSTRLHDWLLANKLFGPPIKDWQEHRAMTLSAKIAAIVGVVGGIGVSTFFFVKGLWIRIVLWAIAAGVTILVLAIKTRHGRS